MKKEILINSTSYEVRIAITEENKLVELFSESPDLSRNVGDLYWGKVAKVMPGIKAAFINVGFPQDAFLHFSDIDTSIDDYSSILGDDDDVDDDDEDEEETANSHHVSSGRRPQVNIERGQDIIVQIIKEPVGNKGVRVTSKVSLPGRYLVLLPFNKRIGVSKKIYNYKERRRLKGIVKSMLPPGTGLIIRTVAAGQDENLIRDDLNKLIATWNDIQNKAKTLKPPAILYKDVSTTNSVVRDLFRDDVVRVLIDSKKLYKEIKAYVDATSPEFSDKIEHYSKSAPIFDVYNTQVTS